MAVLEELRSSWPAGDIPELVAARAAMLQREEPQLPDIVHELQEQRGLWWSKTMSAEWVWTRAVVHTADTIWGEFDRSESERGARWVPEKTRELLGAADLAPFLAKHFVGGYAGVRSSCSGSLARQGRCMCSDRADHTVPI